jgi:hypothetical protein
MVVGSGDEKEREGCFGAWIVVVVVVVRVVAVKVVVGGGWRWWSQPFIVDNLVGVRCPAKNKKNAHIDCAEKWSIATSKSKGVLGQEVESELALKFPTEDAHEHCCRANSLCCHTAIALGKLPGAISLAHHLVVNENLRCS